MKCRHFEGFFGATENENKPKRLNLMRICENGYPTDFQKSTLRATLQTGELNGIVRWVKQGPFKWKILSFGKPTHSQTPHSANRVRVSRTETPADFGAERPRPQYGTCASFGALYFSSYSHDDLDETDLNCLVSNDGRNSYFFRLFSHTPTFDIHSFFKAYSPGSLYCRGSTPSCLVALIKYGQYTCTQSLANVYAFPAVHLFLNALFRHTKDVHVVFDFFFFL